MMERILSLNMKKLKQTRYFEVFLKISNSELFYVEHTLILLNIQI